MRPEPEPALQPPQRDLSDFPAYELTEGRQVARSHSHDKGVWWFSSAPSDIDEKGGRFDLQAPRGTIYAADSVDAAVRERLRSATINNAVVSPKLADNFQVTLLTMTQSSRCAHIDVSAAGRYGVTRELATIPPSQYQLSRQWAEAFRKAGFEGIRYGVRFTPGRANAWALFGNAGDAELPHPRVDQILTGREACQKCGLRVTPVPRIESLTLR